MIHFLCFRFAFLNSVSQPITLRLHRLAHLDVSLIFVARLFPVSLIMSHGIGMFKQHTSQAHQWPAVQPRPTTPRNLLPISLQATYVPLFFTSVATRQYQSESEKRDLGLLGSENPSPVARHAGFPSRWSEGRLAVSPRVSFWLPPIEPGLPRPSRRCRCLCDFPTAR